jgi:hypothetical protein
MSFSFGINMGDPSPSYNIKIDTKEFEEKIRKVRQDIPNIAKKLMARVFSAMRYDIKGNIRSNFKRHKGWLYNDVNYWAFNDFSGAIFTRNSKRQGAHYASVLENGMTILPKKHRYLYIYSGKNSNDKPILKHVESVTIPPRPFVKPVVDDFWGNGGYKASKLMDDGLEKELRKYIENKGGGFIVKETDD